jgi:hypothetical protein
MIAYEYFAAFVSEATVSVAKSVDKTGECQKKRAFLRGRVIKN